MAQLARPRGDSEATLWATLPRLLLLLLRLLLLLFTIKVCLAATFVVNSLRTQRERGRGVKGPLDLSFQFACCCNIDWLFKF